MQFDNVRVAAIKDGFILAKAGRSWQGVIIWSYVSACKASTALPFIGFTTTVEEGGGTDKKVEI